MSLKHYVEFFYCGILVSETEAKQIKSRKEEFKIPKGSYGCRYFDREEVKRGGETLIGKKKNYSGMYYLGKTMSLEEVKEEFPRENILIRNMEGNGWKHVVKTRMGNFQPFHKRDRIIVANKEVI